MHIWTPLKVEISISFRFLGSCDVTNQGRPHDFSKREARCFRNKTFSGFMNKWTQGKRYKTQEKGKKTHKLRGRGWGPPLWPPLLPIAFKKLSCLFHFTLAHCILMNYQSNRKNMDKENIINSLPAHLISVRIYIERILVHMQWNRKVTVRVRPCKNNPDFALLRHLSPLILIALL